MKIRTNFVSNSSSSSFIIGIGKVTDEAKAKKFLSNYEKEAKWDRPEIFTLDQIVNRDYDRYCPVIYSDGYIRVEAFTGQDVGLKVDLTKEQNDKFFIVDITNNEGDTGEGTELYEAVYEGDSVSESYFTSPQNLIFDINEKKDGISDFRYAYGAARNG